MDRGPLPHANNLSPGGRFEDGHSFVVAAGGYQLAIPAEGHSIDCAFMRKVRHLLSTSDVKHPCSFIVAAASHPLAVWAERKSLDGTIVFKLGYFMTRGNCVHSYSVVMIHSSQPSAIGAESHCSKRTAVLYDSLLVGLKLRCDPQRSITLNTGG